MSVDINQCVLCHIQQMEEEFIEVEVDVDVLGTTTLSVCEECLPKYVKKMRAKGKEPRITGIYGIYYDDYAKFDPEREWGYKKGIEDMLAKANVTVEQWKKMWEEATAQ